MNRTEFELLRTLATARGKSVAELAEETGLDACDCRRALDTLTADGLVEDARISAKGLRALAPYKVENAVIMAAGMSTRFAPISYEKPKGLLRVRGDVLIERQIEQLKEAGINEIIVVVGYMKELFYYLEGKYGVHIVDNPEYASRNNSWTLLRVREALGNTYVCSSDNYFLQNPFDLYVWKPYYAAQYSDGPTNEWCLQVDEQNRMTSVVIGGADSWYMAGQVYFDRAFSDKLAPLLECACARPDGYGLLWEDVMLEHLDDFDMEVRRCPNGTIFEFDSLDDLRDFDPMFLDNVDSNIVENICVVLGCEKSEIHDVYPLKEGLTNLSCHFATSDGEYVYRHPGIGTEQMIDRGAEAAAQHLALAIGLDNTFIFENPRKGWKLSRFLPNCSMLDPHNDSQLAEAMALARKLHAQDTHLDRAFDYLAEGLRYESLLMAKGPISVEGYDGLRRQALRVKQLADADGAPVCLTHNDFFELNLLRDAEGNLSLIDWEYAGMSDYASDYGTFVVTCQLSREEADRALEHYFGRVPTMQERRHNLAYVGLAGWCWWVWSLQKESEGDHVGEWLGIYLSYAKEYLPLAISLYEGSCG